MLAKHCNNWKSQTVSARCIVLQSKTQHTCHLHRVVGASPHGAMDRGFLLKMCTLPPHGDQAKASVTRPPVRPATAADAPRKLGHTSRNMSAVAVVPNRGPGLVAAAAPESQWRQGSVWQWQAEAEQLACTCYCE